jgi:hypothetical protein
MQNNEKAASAIKWYGQNCILNDKIKPPACSGGKSETIILFMKRQMKVPLYREWFWY